jgi:AraC-like DNA-binding protein
MLDAGVEGSLADLAAGLGWFDQNQFARDFGRMVGESPSAYRNRSLSPSKGPSSQQEAS